MRVLVLAVLAVLVGFGVLGCLSAIEPTGPKPREVYPVRDCAAACSHLAKLGCEDWRGSPGPDGVFGTDDDASCVDVCVDVLDTGIPMPTGCMAVADDCDDADQCMANGPEICLLQMVNL